MGTGADSVTAVHYAGASFIDNNMSVMSVMSVLCARLLQTSVLFLFFRGEFWFLLLEKPLKPFFVVEVNKNK